MSLKGYQVKKCEITSWLNQKYVGNTKNDNFLCPYVTLVISFMWRGQEYNEESFSYKLETIEGKVRIQCNTYYRFTKLSDACSKAVAKANEDYIRDFIEHTLVHNIKANLRKQYERAIENKRQELAKLEQQLDDLRTDLESFQWKDEHNELRVDGVNLELTAKTTEEVFG